MDKNATKNCQKLDFVEGMCYNATILRLYGLAYNMNDKARIFRFTSNE